MQAITEIIGALAGLLPRLNHQLNQAEQQQALETQVLETQRAAAGGIKPDPPADFDGMESKVEGFIIEATFYLESLRVTNDQDKVIWALSKMKGGTNGRASGWADLQRSNMQVQRTRQRIWDADTNPPHLKGDRPLDEFINWENFVEAFKCEFSIRDERGTAIEAIRKIEQGSRTCDEYATEFCTIMP